MRMRELAGGGQGKNSLDYNMRGGTAIIWILYQKKVRISLRKPGKNQSGHPGKIPSRTICGNRICV
jgi:hypothetical protein